MITTRKNMNKLREMGLRLKDNELLPSFVSIITVSTMRATISSNRIFASNGKYNPGIVNMMHA